MKLRHGAAGVLIVLAVVGGCGVKAPTTGVTPLPSTTAGTPTPTAAPTSSATGAAPSGSTPPGAPPSGGTASSPPSGVLGPSVTPSAGSTAPSDPPSPTSSTGGPVLSTPATSPDEVLRLDLKGVGESSGSLADAPKGDYLVRAACTDGGAGSTSVKITLELDAPKGSKAVSSAKTIRFACDATATEGRLRADVNGFAVSLRSETQDDSVRGYAILVRTALS